MQVVHVQVTVCSSSGLVSGSRRKNKQRYAVSENGIAAFIAMSAADFDIAAACKQSPVDLSLLRSLIGTRSSLYLYRTVHANV